MTPPKVDYVASARRHLKDAHVLQAAGRKANAGQLFGFSVECGLKATLVATGAPVDPDGNIQHASGWRQHLPKLGTLITNISVLPDGRSASLIHGHLHTLSAFTDWHTDHRYFRTAAIPLASSLDGWEMAALETDALLDDMKVKGLL
jgi:hypothetical protein